MDIWTISLIAAAIIIVTVFILRWVLTVLQILHTHLFGKWFRKRRDFPKYYGEWAVVTGASRGIGKHYSKELAKRGMNVVLISKTEHLLRTLADELEKTFKVKTKVVVVDFNLGEDEHFKMFKALDGLDIGVLVNNVGSAEGLPNCLETMTRTQMWSIIMINVGAVTSLSHHFLPAMKKKGKGLIVNVSSLTCLSPTPYGIIYGASKAYITSFSEALAGECKGTGVEVQTLCPGFVDTDIAQTNAHMMPGVFFPTPELYSKCAVGTIGISSSTTGYLPHDIQYYAFDSLPLWARIWICSKFVNVAQLKSRLKG